MAEQIVNEFTVECPIDEAWPIICDLERIAPCLPGAHLDGVEGTVYRGTVKVKLGPITTEFAGEAQLTERDDTAHRATLIAQGRGAKGNGRASAEISAEAEAVSPTSTRCVVTTDLQITGKVAQLGRGVIGDVSKKLMDEFAANLDAMLAEGGEAAPTSGSPTSGSPTTGSPTTVAPVDGQRPADVPAPASPSGDRGTVPPVAPATIGAGPWIKAVAPVVGVLLVLLWMRKRR